MVPAAPGLPGQRPRPARFPGLLDGLSLRLLTTALLGASTPRAVRDLSIQARAPAKSASHGAAPLSEGARQSLRGERDPPEPTFGAFGSAERLNWLKRKNRSRKTRSQRRISFSV